MVEITQKDNIACAKITAQQLHMYFIPELKEKLMSSVTSEPDFLIVDLARVEYLDSSAMGVLFLLQKKLNAYGGQLLLTGINPTIELVFRLTKSDEHFTIHSTFEKALECVRG